MVNIQIIDLFIWKQILNAKIIFRHASVSSTYTGLSIHPSVPPSVGDIFGFPFRQRLWALTKRRDDIAVANMVDDMAADIFKVYKAWNVLKQRVLGRNCLMRNVPACLLSFPSLLFCELLNYQWSLITHLFLHIFQTFCCEDEGAEIPAICLRPINVLQRDAVSRECAIENCHRDEADLAGFKTCQALKRQNARCFQISVVIKLLNRTNMTQTIEILIRLGLSSLGQSCSKWQGCL